MTNKSDYKEGFLIFFLRWRIDVSNRVRVANAEQLNELWKNTNSIFFMSRSTIAEVYSMTHTKKEQKMIEHNVQYILLIFITDLVILASLQLYTKSRRGNR